MSSAHAMLGGASSRIFEGLDAAAGPAFALVLVAVVANVLLLGLLRGVSTPERLRRERRRAEAELLAVRLYRHDVTTVLHAQARFAWFLARYLAGYARPIALLLVPAGLLLAHLDAHYGTRALRPGEEAVVEVVASGEWELAADGGLAVEVGPVREPEGTELAWRVRASGEGPGRLVLRGAGGETALDLPVSDVPRGAAPSRRAAGVGAFVFAPAHPPIDRALGIERFEVDLPPLELTLGRWRTSWWVVFLAVTLAVGVALRRPFGIE